MDTAKKVIDDLRRRYNFTDIEIANLAESQQPIIWRLRTGKAKDCMSSLYIRLCLLREKMSKPRTKK